MADLSTTSGRYANTGLVAETPPLHVRVAEGHAVVMMPPSDKAKTPQESPIAQTNGEDPTAIFYNKAQVVNRDLSVCVLETFAKLRATETRRKGGTGDDGIVVLEALSATGLRALRYWHEVEGIRHVIANDLDPEAVECIKANCERNGVPIVSAEEFNSTTWTGAPPGEDRKAAMEKHKQRVAACPRGVVPTCEDAVVLMQQLALDPDKYSGRTLQWARGSGPISTPVQKQAVDVVDLDPYGTASPFLDAACASAKEGALMLVTCTDSAILCGNYSETCHAKYNSLSTRIASCHELAPRIVLASIERAANKHNKYIEPLLSLHIDFYIRVFVRIRTQAAEVKLSAGKLGYVYHCTDCPAYTVRPVGRLRPSRAQRRQHSGAQDTHAESSPEKVHRAETNAGSQLAPTLPGAGNLGVAPVRYPATPDRSTPLHCTAPSIDDVPRRCVVCEGRVAIAGPIYAAPSHDPTFLDGVLATMECKGRDKLKAFDRVRGLVLTARNELRDSPLFYKVPDFASVMKMQVPPAPVVVGALCRLGYECSQVHCEPVGLKTTAPPQVIANVLLTYRETVLVPAAEAERARREEDGAANSKRPMPVALPERIHASVIDGLDLSYDKQYDASSRATGVAKFVPNPAFWGPLARHAGVAKNEK